VTRRSARNEEAPAAHGAARRRPEEDPIQATHRCDGAGHGHVVGSAAAQRDDGGLQDSARPGRPFRRAKCRRRFLYGKFTRHAEDLQEVLRLQSQFAQSQMQAYVAQAQELGPVMTAAAKTKL
jgi:hypothetical protein